MQRELDESAGARMLLHLLGAHAEVLDAARLRARGVVCEQVEHGGRNRGHVQVVPGPVRARAVVEVDLAPGRTNSTREQGAGRQ